MAKKDNKIDVSHLDSADKTILIHMLQEQINLLKEKNARLNKRYKDLEQRFKLLEGRLSKNSSNSSKPPSSDIGKPNKRNSTKKTTSSKKKTGKKPGGQPGHKGHHLAMSDTPDEVIVLAVDHCLNCNSNLKRSPCTTEKRQLFEIPEPKMWVIEYQVQHKYCKQCDHVTSTCFPDELTHKTQYGPRAKSLMVYMNEHQLLPFERSSEFFETIYHHKISPGTISNAVTKLSNRLDQVENGIKQLLIQSSLVHCDETGVSIKGKKHWLHTVGNKQLTHFSIHQKRGSEATKAIGILPEFKGKMIHDHWKSYFQYEDCIHGLCNAHHIRELRFLYEHQNIKWARKMSDLLIQINDKKMQHLKMGRYFSANAMKKYNDQYDDLLKKATPEQARRGTIDSHNLLKRLKNYKAAVLLFMTDKEVPFTNNLSERDIRMNKVKKKISGCYRTTDAGNNSCVIRSALSTAKKNSKNIFNILYQSFYKIISVDDLLAGTTANTS